MTIKQAAASARKQLEEAGIDDAALEAELLLRFVLGVDRSTYFTELEAPMTELQEHWYAALIDRRLKGEPAAYIVGRREFYGFAFRVTPDVLIPRPETEILVEKAIELVNSHSYHTVADIGTGSGCIAITVAMYCQRTTVQAVDISQQALEVAIGNVHLYGIDDRVICLQGNLLEPLEGPVDLIAANLPYVFDADLPDVNTIGFEPELALGGGEDGLILIRELINHLPEWLNPGGSVLLEIDPRQAETVTSLLQTAYPDGSVSTLKDLAGRDRVITLTIS